MIQYKNPIPVTIMLVPTTKGILLVRRGLKEAYGELALPGGYHEEGETWQEGGCREVLEETGVVLDPGKVRLFDMVTPKPAMNRNLTFGLYTEVVTVENEGFTSNETLGIEFCNEAIPLAFPNHTLMLARYFEK